MAATNDVLLTLTEAEKAHNQQVSGDRTRTIDQIKRLYAVVMGFALTTCFANIYQCVKITHVYSSYSVTLLAQGVCFVTLIVLFYLGAERLLDNRYLRIESQVPSRFGLFIDLFIIGTTAILFVILADTFPDLNIYKDQPSMETALAYNIRLFTAVLLLLYVVDTLFLLIQIWRIHRNRSGDFALLIRHHWFWFTLNVLGVILLYPVIINFTNHPIAHALTFWVPNWMVSLFNDYFYLSMYIIILHVLRFIADYCYAFDSYYPQDLITHGSPVIS